MKNSMIRFHLDVLHQILLEGFGLPDEAGYLCNRKTFLELPVSYEDQTNIVDEIMDKPALRPDYLKWIK